MTGISRYIFESAGRRQLMKYLGVFSVVGGTIVTAILLAATFMR